MKCVANLPFKHLLREYEAPPPQVREQSLQAPQASQPPSLSSSERVILEVYKKQREKKKPESAWSLLGSFTDYFCVEDY